MTCPVCEKKKAEFEIFLRFAMIMLICLSTAVVTAVCVLQTLTPENLGNMLFGLFFMAIGAAMFSVGEKRVASLVLRR